MDEDPVVAPRPQEEWDVRAAPREAAREPQSPVDASWELADPTPDLQALFVQFNDRFFWGQLEAVEVKWSVRMTQCAGVCSYEGRGGMCSIRLSEPLLKLRPRKDLVETLLHEMIHAYLFVTNNDKDRQGHGPEFCKHMQRINHLTGANITVYHTFHDEVDEYRRHWWRCDGPCQHRQPYYGYVKRATNRPPSPHECWWAEHQKTCGGTYVKIREPEHYARKGKGRAKPGRPPAPAVGQEDGPGRAGAPPPTPVSRNGEGPGEKPAPSRAIGEAQGLLSQDHPAGARRPDSNMEVKFEQNDFSRKTSSHLVCPAPSTSLQSVTSSHHPRVSVASQAFRGVNGSPAKTGSVGDVTRCPASPGSQGRDLLPEVSPRSASQDMASTAAACEGSGSADHFPSKRPRLKGKTAFDNSPKSPVAAARSSGSSRSQSHRVRCPVCQGEVLESQINEHLDWCLQGDSTKGRCRNTRVLSQTCCRTQPAQSSLQI